MLGVTWIAGLVRRRLGRLAAVAVGIALAVGLLASIGSFVSHSKATMTKRSAATVAVDWQVEVQPGGDANAVARTIAQQPGVRSALPVGFAETSGLSATAGGTTQTTGTGVVLGIPAGYRAAFPDAIRDLVGAPTGVLVAQQTAANLHVAPGDTITIGRAGPETDDRSRRRCRRPSASAVAVPDGRRARERSPPRLPTTSCSSRSSNGTASSTR